MNTKENLDAAKAEIAEIIKRRGVDAFVLLYAGEFTISQAPPIDGKQGTMASSTRSLRRISTIANEAKAIADRGEDDFDAMIKCAAKAQGLSDDLKENAEWLDGLVKILGPSIAITRDAD